MALSTITDITTLPAVLTIRHIQHTLGIAKGPAYALVNRDDFPAIRLGRSIRVPRDAFFRWLDQQAGAQE